MPTDQLTTAPTACLADGVLSVLAGGDFAQIAAQFNMTPEELDEAVCVYQAAGVAALEQRAEREWFQVRIQFVDWNAAEKIGAGVLLPQLDRLEQTGAITGWWFLRKYPCWRIRVLGIGPCTPAQSVAPVLDELAAAGHIQPWQPTIYEPEVAAFGGDVGVNAAHSLFFADSRGVLEYVSHPAPGLGPREMSMLLCAAMMRVAGLDSFECGDVFDRVTRLRPRLTAEAAPKIEKLAADVGRLLRVPVSADSALFAPGGPAHQARPWLYAFEAAGRTFGEAAASGTLERGLRAILTHIVIFHWNRLGLSATQQRILARAATLATLPRS
ncbi:thiopeptide-type bacteriocin biosynthesis protein [Actinospica robiniae]|uniref:thiopeptide-type bacteriocin biosynthesis protein n=1 Tax=Actinospica robiniae TaxID=304901 RepID=UPI00054EABB6|nr:thiopeptide-type bacteriocin biosynthesis protein [Actinospica robiniae]